MFIVFEGIDHSGKTTLSRLVASRLGFTWSKEPVFSSERADELNHTKTMNPWERELAFMEGRLEQQKLYDSGNIVLDRYVWSGLAYAYVNSYDVFKAFSKIYANGKLFKVPDVYVFVDTPLQVCYDRGDDKERETMDYLASVQRAYTNIKNFKLMPQGSLILTVNGNRDIDENVDLIVGKIENMMGLVSPLHDGEE